MASQKQVSYTIHRKTWLTKILPTIARLVLFNHKIVLKGLKNLPKTGPAIILCKHVSRSDTLLIGLVIYLATKRFGIFVMRASRIRLLDTILEYAGGVRFYRSKDILRYQNRKHRRKKLRAFMKENTQSMKYLSWLLAEKSEIVVIFPEGRFYPGTMGPLKGSIINEVLGLGENAEYKLPVIPIGIKHENNVEKQISVNIGEPLSYVNPSTDRSFLIKLSEVLSELSGIDRVS